MLGEVMQNGEKMPTFDDFIGGSMALVGLQDTYGLNLSEVILGSLGSDEPVPQSPYELTGDFRLIKLVMCISVKSTNKTCIFCSTGFAFSRKSSI